MSGKKALPSAESVENTVKKRHARRRTILGILAVASLGIGLWLHGFGSMSTVPAAPPSAERRDPMFATKQKQATDHGVPPIDVSAPVKTETATFALG